MKPKTHAWYAAILLMAITNSVAIAQDDGGDFYADRYGDLQLKGSLSHAASGQYDPIAEYERKYGTIRYVPPVPPAGNRADAVNTSQRSSLDFIWVEHVTSWLKSHPIAFIPLAILFFLGYLLTGARNTSTAKQTRIEPMSTETKTLSESIQEMADHGPSGAE